MYEVNVSSQRNRTILMKIAHGIVFSLAFLLSGKMIGYIRGRMVYVNDGIWKSEVCESNDIFLRQKQSKMR